MVAEQKNGEKAEKEIRFAWFSVFGHFQVFFVSTVTNRELFQNPLFAATIIIAFLLRVKNQASCLLNQNFFFFFFSFLENLTFIF